MSELPPKPVPQPPVPEPEFPAHMKELDTLEMPDGLEKGPPSHPDLQNLPSPTNPKMPANPPGTKPLTVGPK